MTTRIAPDAVTCGIDIGGTKIAGAVVAADGTILATHRVVSPATDPSAMERAAADLVRTLAAEHPVVAVGVGAAGYIDEARATVRFAPNIAWRNERLGPDLARLTGLPVVVENDANAAAWGEFRFGAGHDVDDQLMVTVGTGVGGGVILGGTLLRGAFGIAAEIGHLCVVPEGRQCGCGNLGCLEQYASGTALVRNSQAAARGRSLLAAEILERAGGDPTAITGPMVTEAAKDGDRFAIEQLEEIGRWLGHGIASLTAVLDPAVVVLGGGVSAAGDLLLDPVREAFRSELTGRGYRPEAEIRIARLGDDAGVIGAADLARH